MIKLSRLMICLMMTAICSGCFYASIPEFKQKEKEPVSCPEIPVAIYQKLAMPEPIPNTVYLDIKDGRVVKADAGGEKLIRQYVSIRKDIKATWSK